jgi:TolB-like protein/DNA-binding winged helix-turn-helix (wHTH) protein
MLAETAPIQFAEYELDARRFELRRDGVAVSLERLPMELLILLASHPGELVSRAEIVAALWGSGGIHVDAETGINTAIRKIRRALGDDIQNPRFIHTVSGKGYRFEPLATVTAQPDRAGPPPAPLNEGPWRHRMKPRARLALVAVAALILLGLAAWQISRGGERAGAGKARLAIMPFENLSPDPQNAFFADGLHEEILSTLSERGAGLEVVSRTTMMSYRQNPKPVAAVAQELRATYVLEGSVRRDGQGVRVSLQLIDAGNDRNLWSHSYDRGLPDSLTLQTDIAAEVAAQLATRLTKPSGNTPLVPADIEVYDDYLRAVLMTQASNQGVKETQMRNADALLTRVIARDPSFGRAYAARAMARIGLFSCGADASEDSVRLIREDLEAARRLIGDDSTVLVAEGYFWAAVMRDYPRALNAYRVADAAGKVDSNILLGKGVALLRMGRVADSLAAHEQGAALDPGNVAALQLWAGALWIAGKPADALRVSDLLRERMPGFPLAAVRAEIIFDFTGKTDEYRAMVANISDPAASLKLRFNLLCYERRFAELKPMLDGVRLESTRLLGLNGGSAYGAGLIPVASYRGWADLLVGDPVSAAMEGQAELDFVARQPEADWNRWYLRLLTAEGNLFTGQKERAIASAREGISLMPRSRDAVTWRQAALLTAQILGWAGAGDEAVALLTELSGANPGVGPALITRDPLIADSLAQNPNFQSLSRELEAKMRDVRLP